MNTETCYITNFSLSHEVRIKRENYSYTNILLIISPTINLTRTLYKLNGVDLVGYQIINFKYGKTGEEFHGINIFFI